MVSETSTETGCAVSLFSTVHPIYQGLGRYYRQASKFVAVISIVPGLDLGRLPNPAVVESLTMIDVSFKRVRACGNLVALAYPCNGPIARGT